MKKLKEYPGYIADRYTYDRLVDVIKYMAMDSADQRAMEIMENSFLNDIKYVPDTEVCCDVLVSSV